MVTEALIQPGRREDGSQSEAIIICSPKDAVKDPKDIPCVFHLKLEVIQPRLGRSTRIWLLLWVGLQPT
ncbi:MAG TPA: hypothetical protein VEP90_20855, partial [Methylomirabilota bacterium]|nr:hypothetical protein [Methylomirabilota bacterium]